MNKVLALVIFTLPYILFDAIGVEAKKTEIPKHPSQLIYKELDWKIPLGTPYRTTLKNGLKCYIAEDHNLPLIKLTLYLRTGTIKDPKGKEGLGSFAAHLMRTGGTEKILADSLDALIEHFAMSFSFSLKETQLIFTAQFLSQYSDTALFIIKQMLFYPAFEEDKIEKERDIAIQKIENQFVNPEPILGSAYNQAMYPQSPISRLSTEKSMRAITRADLKAFHKSVFRTENCLLAVSGDFNKANYKEKLSSVFPRSKKRRKANTFPQILLNQKKKCIIVHKRISQAHVRLGLPLFTRPHPDYYPLSLFNVVLGGGSFTSRLGTTIRSDEGLTYSIYSHIKPNYIFPGTFFINFFTKNATVKKALDLTIKEVQKIVKEGITSEELVNAKKVLLDGLPSMFRSREDIVDTYAWNEYYKRVPKHYRIYPKKINALTKKDILKVAQKYIDPDAFTYIIVGDTTELFKPGQLTKESLNNNFSFKIITPDQLYEEISF